MSAFAKAKFILISNVDYNPTASPIENQKILKIWLQDGSIQHGDIIIAVRKKWIIKHKDGLRREELG